MSMNAMLGLSVFQFSPSISFAYLDIIPRLSAELHATVYKQSVLSTVTRLLDRLDLYPLVPLSSVLLKLSFAALLIPLLLSGRFLPKNARAAQIWLFMSVAIVALLLSPTVWYHYSTLLLPPIALLLFRRSTAGKVAALLALLLIQSCRFLEHVAILLPVSVVVGLLVLLSAVVGVYARTWMSKRSVSGTLRAHSLPLKATA
jgi:hypothetical protein